MKSLLSCKCIIKVDELVFCVGVGHMNLVDKGDLYLELTLE